MAKRWRCTVCGYIHEGDEPPDVCPVCGADRSQFVPDDVAEANLLQDLIANFRLHSVVAHFPCGLLPTCALFLLVYLITGSSRPGGNGLLAAAGGPGGRAGVPGLGALCLAEALCRPSCRHLHEKDRPGAGSAAAWPGRRAFALRSPGLMAAGGWHSWLYLACFGGMLGCAVLLGHYGSKLVFQAHGENRARLPTAQTLRLGTWPRRFFDLNHFLDVRPVVSSIHHEDESSIGIRQATGG